MQQQLASQQLVSKQRVRDHGEVFTHQREVTAMCDLVKAETERTESRFLEPACGTGNFLAEIVSRKLSKVEVRFGRSQLEFERNAVLAISSVYGIDILEDNVLACRERLFRIFDAAYTARFKKKAKARCRTAVRFILKQNIVRGDALTLQTAEGAADSHALPIEFSEWSPVAGSLLKRRVFAFYQLLPPTPEENSLFAEPVLASDLGKTAFIPVPVREYPVTHFLKVADAEHA